MSNVCSQGSGYVLFALGALLTAGENTLPYLMGRLIIRLQVTIPLPGKKKSLLGGTYSPRSSSPAPSDSVSQTNSLKRNNSTSTYGRKDSVQAHTPSRNVSVSYSALSLFRLMSGSLTLTQRFRPHCSVRNEPRVGKLC